MPLQSSQSVGGTEHSSLHHVRSRLYGLYALAQFLISLANLLQGKLKKTVFLRVVRLYLLFYSVEVGCLLAMFCKAVLYVVGCQLQFVCPNIRFLAMQAMARTIDNVLASLYELLLFALKHTPPYYVGVFALCVGRKAMKRAAHIVERQHTILTLNVLHDGTPMLMVIELGT